MDSEAGGYGGVAWIAATGGDDAAMNGIEAGGESVAGYGTLPIIEISDRDYRSFCWPCHALEEPGDCNTED